MNCLKARSTRNGVPIRYGAFCIAELAESLGFRILVTESYPQRFLKSWDTPLSLDGRFHGKSENKMDDDWGYPYDLGNLYVSLDLRLLCSADFPTETRHFPPVNGNSYGSHGPSIDDLAIEHGSRFSIAMFPGGEIHLIVIPKIYPIVSHKKIVGV